MRGQRQVGDGFEALRRIRSGGFGRARGGAGLGLAIAASLAAAHGGEPTVDTQPGHGAAFCLRLPQAETFQRGPAAIRSS